MGSKDEKRAFSRAFAHNRVEIGSGDDTLTGRLGDIGMNGLFVVTDGTLPTGHEFPVRVFLEISENESLRLNMQGRIARTTGQGMAVEFTEIESDSFEHLRKLVLYNAVEPQKAEREFDEHPGIRRRASSR